jgi:predicted PurR-regulated permease PerM
MKLVEIEAIENRRNSLLKIVAVTTTIVAAAVIALLFYKLRNVFVLFVISGLLAYVLNPIVEFFEHRGIRRTLVVTFMFTAFVLFLTLFGMIVGPIFIDQLSQLQYDIPKINSFIKSMPDHIESWTVASIPQLKDAQIAKRLQEFSSKYDLRGKLSPLISKVISFASGVFAIFGMMVVVPFLVFFFLKDGRNMRKSLIESVPNKHFEMTLTLIHELDRQLGKYIRGRAAETLIVSIISIIAFYLCGIPYYAVLGLISGVANLVPYIGPALTGVPAAILAIPHYHLMAIPIVIGIILLIQLIDNSVVFPIVVGKSVDLSPITTIFAIFVGSELLGLLGMLIAVPLTSMAKVAISIIYRELKGPPDVLI